MHPVHPQLRRSLRKCPDSERRRPLLHLELGIVFHLSVAQLQSVFSATWPQVGGAYSRSAMVGQSQSDSAYDCYGHWTIDIGPLDLSCVRSLPGFLRKNPVPASTSSQL